MVDRGDVTRRSLLGAIGAGLVPAAAGCLDDGADGEDGTPDETSDGTGAGAGGEGTRTQTTMTEPTESGPEPEDLDLQEANVVGVSVTEQNGQYDFEVSLHHDDDGESGYANWWQVERLDGTRLGRRELLHAHSRQPFTRSETVEIPASVSCVIVRGHDQSHGYGGMAMLVELSTGATAAIDQGSEKQEVSPGDCP